MSHGSVSSRPTDRPTNQPTDRKTDRPGHREVNLPIIII